MEMGKKLRKLRLDRGLTQQQVADRLGMTRQALSSYEGGRTWPDLQTLERLCAIYNVSLEEMVHGQPGAEEEKKKQGLRRLKTGVIVFAALLAASTFLSSGLLWSANRFFPAETGQLSAQELAAFEQRRQLTSLWEGLDGIILVLSLAGGLWLLWQKRRKGIIPPWGPRWKALALWGAGMLLAALPFALTDPVMEPVNYLVTPLYVWARLLLLWLADLGLDLAERHGKKKTG